MQKCFGYSQLQASSVRVAGATITVYLSGTLTLATIFSDQLNTPLANPFTADANGYWFFYAANGVYDVRFSGGAPSISPAYTLSGFLLNDISTPLAAAFDQVRNSADIVTTTLFTPATAGMYRIGVYIALTQAATVSSTLPAVSLGWIDADSNVGLGQQVTPLNPTNTLGGSSATVQESMLVFNIAAGVGVAFNASGYTSVGATPMLYSIHIRVWNE